MKDDYLLTVKTKLCVAVSQYMTQILNEKSTFKYLNLCFKVSVSVIAIQHDVSIGIL